jgi:AraC-like DNA-binding protein
MQARFRDVQARITTMVPSAARSAGMPFSTVKHLADVEELTAEMRPPTRDYVLAKQGRFDAVITRIDFRRLRIEVLAESLPRLWRIEMPPDLAAIHFADEAGTAVRCDGTELGACEFGLLAPGRDVWHGVSGGGQVTGLALPPGDLAELGRALVGGEIALDPDTLSATVSPARLARLRRLCRDAARLARTAPEIMATPGAARGLEATLTEAMVLCLASPRMRADSASKRKHATVMKRFLALAQDHANQPMPLPEVCAAVGVTQRTLQACCQEQLGLSPRRYLTLRRLHLAHGALRRAAPGEATVTDIATQYGFWELSRFAGVYRSLFGQSPSVTLRAGKGNSEAAHGGLTLDTDQAHRAGRAL